MDASQLRAARAMLDWTRPQMAKATGLHPRTIKQIEDGEVRPHEATEKAIVALLSSHKIELTERGVRWRDDTVRVIEGEDAYSRLLDDIHATLIAGGESLFMCADDRNQRQGEVAAEERLRASGVRFRSLIEEGNDVVRWSPNEYRQIPSTYFNYDLQVIYGDKVAQLINGGQKILIVHDASFATTARNLFNMVWLHSKPITGKENKQ